MRKKRDNIIEYIRNRNILFLGIVTFIIEVTIHNLSPIINNDLLLFVVFLLSISITLLDKKNKNRYFNVIYLIGLFFRTRYILNTSIHMRQHDVTTTFDLNGHFDYIYTLYKTFNLPQTLSWQFSHPPLWHMLASCWLLINKFLLVDFNVAVEGIQILTVFLSSFSIIIVKLICDKLKIKNKYTYIATLLIAVHPTMIILSGSINNDMLLTFLEFLIIYRLILWYEKANIKNTILLAIVTGLSVMTKSNGAIMAIPIMYIFIKKFLTIIKSKHKKIKDYIGKIVLFATISLPIGLWYQLRNLIKFGKSTMINNPPDTYFIGNISLKSRFLSLNFYELFIKTDALHNTNLLATLLKTSIFGEWDYNNIGIFGIILMVLNIIMIFISIMLMIRYIFKDRKNEIINTLIITFVIAIISFYVFNYTTPYSCSMDFRYIVISLLPGIVIISYELDKIKNKYLKGLIEIMSYTFILLSGIFALLF